MDADVVQTAEGLLSLSLSLSRSLAQFHSVALLLDYSRGRGMKARATTANPKVR